MNRFVTIFGLSLVAVSCSKSPKEVVVVIDSGSMADLSPTPDAAVALPDRCLAESARWAPGAQAFRDGTQDTGLGAIVPAGVRISAVDYDSDGFADLFLRRTGAVGDDFDGTRSTWLLHNRGDGTFEDLTQASGIVGGRFSPNASIGRPADVAAFADVDNDGDLDVVTAYTSDGANPEGAELMLNDGDGTFSFGSLDLPFRRAGAPTSVGGLTWTDVDRDGLVDLWMGQGAVGAAPLADRLYVQQSDGAFVDATSARGLETQDWSLPALNAGLAHSNAWSTAACDLDNDGNVELLAASYGRAPDKMFHGLDGGMFEDFSVASGYASDERIDWSGNESARCWCLLNPTDADCSGVPLPNIACQTNADAFRWNHASDREPFRLGGNSGTTACGDVDNDGDLDLLTTEIVHWDVGSSSDPSELLINDGSGTFTRPGNDVTGLTRTHTVTSWNDGDITAALFDFDNDGRLDVLIASTDYDGTRAHLYHQKPDGTFEAVPLAEGIDHTSAHGIGIADFDQDGDLDVVLGHSRNRCSTGTHCYESAGARYFENVVGQDANWVQLRLEGADGTNRAAIGARVTIETDGLTQVREVGGGHGHYGMQHDLAVDVGLGEACQATVTVRWPDANLTEETFEVQSGYRYDVKQGAAPAPR